LSSDEVLFCTEWADSIFVINNYFIMKADFIDQLKGLGLQPQEPFAGKIYFEWEVPVGVNIGKKVLIGTTVDDSYPAACPTPPHFKPLGSGWREHTDSVSDSTFGQGWDEYPSDDSVISYQVGWRYWSRRFDEWPLSDKNAKIYMSHLRKLMMSI
jgi:hypothetical protein